MSGRPQTPSQTIGPFFHDALMRYGVDQIDPDAEAGAPIVVVGSVLDGAGDIVSDAMVEVWQADGSGRYRHPADGRVGDVPSSFIGFGRVASTDEGTFRVSTAMPGTVPGPNGSIQAPHLSVQIFARGLLDRLCTRIYFPDLTENADDPVLGQVPEERRDTLIARPEGQEGGASIYRFDIVLQGEGETVFFDV